MFLVRTFTLLTIFLLVGCATSRPGNVDDVCAIFEDRPKWYRAAKRSAEKWGGPIYMPMAIMYQESGFRRKARPPMQYFLGVIPIGRKSDAYGYSQALKSTWKEYQREAGSSLSSRARFSDAYDFVQWYMHKSWQRNRVSKLDGYAQYLNYHEGHGGYARGTYRSKQWLINTAKTVDRRAKKFATQLSRCDSKLNQKRGWF